MATKWISPTWRMPEESNQSKVDNYSLEFNGSDEHIAATYSGDVYACSIWFKPDTTITTSTLVQYLISFGGTFDGILLGSATSSLSNELIIVEDSTPVGRSAYTQAGGTITNTWHHLCFNWSGSVYEIWLDGVNVQNTTTGTPTLISASQIQIGRRSTGTSYYYFEGEIGQTTVYDSALTSDQITALYSSGTPVNPMALTPLPTAYYPLGGSSTGSASTLTIPNESVPSATVFDFTGVNGVYVDAGNNSSINFTSAFSVGFWFKTSSSAIMYTSHGSTGDIKYYIQWYAPINRLRLAVYDGSGTSLIVDNTQVFDDDNWHHLAFTTDGTTSADKVIVYFDGQPLTTTGTLSNSGIKSTVGSLKIGAYVTTQNTFDGELSNFQTWGTELSAPNITTLYNNGVPLLSGTQPQAANLKGWWKMNIDTSNWDGSDWIIGEAQANYTSALSFDGVNDYITFPADASLNISTANHSMSFWLKTTDSGICVVSQKYGAQNELAVWIQSSKIKWAAENPFSSTSNINDGTWKHICFVADGSSSYIYINGVLDATGGSQIRSSASASAFAIGSRPGSFPYEGSISNWSLFNKALTEDQVLTIYNNGTPETVISLSPVSWWKLDNLTTGIQDSGSASNNGTNNGATVTDIQVSTLNGISSGMTTANLVNSDLTRSIPYSSYSMVFDAAGTDRINIGNPTELQITSNLSISIWVKQTTVQDAMVIDKDSGAAGTRSWSLWTNAYQAPNVARFVAFRSDNTDCFVDSTTRVDDGNWHHIVGTYEPSTAIKIYIDGKLENTNTVDVPSSIPNTSANVIIGEWYAAGSFEFPGNISNAAIFDSTLTEDQVLTIYNGGVPNDISSLSPVGWWSLGGDSYYASDWICPDLGSGGNNGTSANLAVTALVGDGPGSTANGIATSMDIPANLKGNAPNSSKNAFSINMNSADRVEDVAPTP